MCTCVCVCVYISIRGLEVVGGLLLLGLMASVCDGASALLFSSRRLQAREESKVFFFRLLSFLAALEGTPFNHRTPALFVFLLPVHCCCCCCCWLFSFVSPHRRRRRRRRKRDGQLMDAGKGKPSKKKKILRSLSP